MEKQIISNLSDIMKNREKIIQLLNPPLATGYEIEKI